MHRPGASGRTERCSCPNRAAQRLGLRVGLLLGRPQGVPSRRLQGAGPSQAATARRPGRGSQTACPLTACLQLSTHCLAALLQSPSAPSPAASCGYGELSAEAWPFHVLAAVSPNSSLALQLAPVGGCGTCLEIACAGPVGAGQQGGAGGTYAGTLPALSASTLGSGSGPCSTSLLDTAPTCMQAGTCQSPSQTVTATVVDSCATCTAQQLTLNVRAFASLADVDRGTMDIRYRQVEACTQGRQLSGQWPRLAVALAAAAPAL